MSLLQDVQQGIQSIFQGKLITAIADDATATLTTIQAQLKAGVITAVAASQRSACPQNILNLIEMIQAAVSVPVPTGAGVLWISDQLNSMDSATLGTFATQIKLIQGACGAMLHMPGMPF